MYGDKTESFKELLDTNVPMHTQNLQVYVTQMLKIYKNQSLQFSMKFSIEITT